jgi:site-specific recombinase XerD
LDDFGVIRSPYRETAEKVLKKTEIDIIEGRYFDIKKNQNVLFEDFADKNPAVGVWTPAENNERIRWLTGLKDFKFHDLRHTFASSLVGKGVDLYAVQKLLGHATPTMTQRYVHLQPDHLHSAIEKIDLHFNCLV